MANEELVKRVYVREIKDELNLTQITGNQAALDRWIIAPDVNRPGMELAGIQDNTNLKRVVIIGNKETMYMNSLPYEVQKERYDYITDAFTPCIIITSKTGCPDALKEVAESKNFPVLSYPGHTYRAVIESIEFLSEKMAPTESMHGVMMNIYGVGVMLTGQSGIGKSELALDLIKRGHILIADDRVDVKRIHSQIIAEAPDVIKSMLEIRGLGVVDVELLFGGAAVLDKTELSLIIKLSRFQDTEFNRVGNDEVTTNVLGIDIPTIEIPVSDGRPISSIVEASVTNYILKRKGINTTETFKEKVRKEIEKNRGIKK